MGDEIGEADPTPFSEKIFAYCAHFGLSPSAYSAPPPALMINKRFEGLGTFFIMDWPPGMEWSEEMRLNPIFGWRPGGRLTLEQTIDVCAVFKCGLRDCIPVKNSCTGP
jgi:hypothetical protein